ncbi:MAG: UDP-N-acetylmuramoyl-tripeptide--D-alanyl-D-alanine ligase [Candidatus Gracilibacteria bacterium]|nr:UDP-N-acetylmuramoyl-tripeptide--D-alanyl-D-alanine ligase [Candidatus Gracilibacteria bacterium]
MICKNILLAYQLENYENIRFLKFIYSHPKFWIFGGNRQNIVWTKKAILIAILTMFIFISKIISISFFMFPDGNLLIRLVSYSLVFLALPVYMIFANLLLWPIDRYLKNKILKRAKAKLASLKNLKIIGITGSYGKTSQKEILETILSGKFKVLSTSGNKNTPLGVSEAILGELDETYDIFIVEMGAYQKGDIKELCDLVNPEIGILTGITLQHLERFGSLENIIQAKFELPESIGENGLLILDTTNENIASGLKSRKSKLKCQNIIELRNPKNVSYLDNLGGIGFDYDNRKFTTKLLAEHSANQIITAYEIAKYLKMENSLIIEAIQKITFTPHRLELIYNPNSNLYVIDDSYNGNFERVKSTVKLLKNINNHRKLYLSPGLVELGLESDKIHLEIGKMLANVIDKALLIENSQTKMIEKGLLESGFNKANIIHYSSTISAHNDLSNIINSGDVIVFQNDLTDNYF